MILLIVQLEYSLFFVRAFLYLLGNETLFIYLKKELGKHMLVDVSRVVSLSSVTRSTRS